MTTTNNTAENARALNAKATKPFTPSSWMLGQMLADADAKFEAARARALAQREERENERAARAIEAEVKARYYARIQRGY